MKDNAPEILLAHAKQSPRGRLNDGLSGLLGRVWGLR